MNDLRAEIKSPTHFNNNHNKGNYDDHQPISLCGKMISYEDGRPGPACVEYNYNFNNQNQKQHSCPHCRGSSSTTLQGNNSSTIVGVTPNTRTNNSNPNYTESETPNSTKNSSYIGNCSSITTENSLNLNSTCSTIEGSESGTTGGVEVGATTTAAGKDPKNSNPDSSNPNPNLSNANGISAKKELLLECPNCYKSLFIPMYDRSGPVIKTTEKRRLNRFCGFFAVFLSLFLLLSSLLEADIDNDALISGAHYWTQPFKIKRLPQCIIIGARKCGTRALIDMLNLHPQVEKAALEVHFFDRDDNYAKGLEWYRQHLPECSEDQLSIEKSPSYFVTPEVPERIHAMNSSIKLLLIVREPVTRVISDYTQIYGTNSKPHNGTKSPRLEELVLQSDGSVNVHYKAIRISLYSRYLQRWLDVFPPAQIHVIDGDALIRDPYPQLRDVERFLGLQPRLQRDNFYFNSTKGFYCWRKLEGESRNETGLHCLNDSKGRRHPPVDRYIVSKLRRFYNPHNLRFYDMVGRDFGWPEK